MKKYNVSIVGATGLVGRELIKLLEDFPVNNLKLFASKKSEGKKLKFKNREIEIQTLKEDSFENTDISFLCAGAKISKKYRSFFRKCEFVIDLSSAFRMEKDVPLIIPEINPHHIQRHKGIIASPNCTTTIMLMALYPLHKEFKIKRIVASTYQAASGGGIKLIEKLEKDTYDLLIEKKSNSNSYSFNLFLHESPLNNDRYSEEEAKMANETKKILEDDNIKVTATCVRVPVLRAHSISLNVEFLKKDITLKKAYELLKNSPNVKILDNFSDNKFATPFDATKKIQTYVSRIRLDLTQKNTLELWTVGDQLLKGAALNAYQIAKKIMGFSRA